MWILERPFSGAFDGLGPTAPQCITLGLVLLPVLVMALRLTSPRAKNAALPGPKTRPLPRRSPAYWKALLPPEVTWLGPKQLETLSHVLDTLLPSFDVAPAQQERLGERLREELGALLFGAEKPLEEKDFALRLPGSSAAVDRFYGRSASDLDLAAKFATVTEKYAAAEDKLGLGLVLRLLDTSLGGMLLGLGRQRFQDASFGQREALLQRMADSRVPQLRQLVQGLKRLGCSLWLGAPYPDTAGSVRNPNWEALEYVPRSDDRVVRERAAVAACETHALKDVVAPVDVTAAVYDVVIVGSGAGGGVAASVLTTRGLKVAVVEKGGFFTEEDFASWTEAQAFEQAYEHAGLLTNKDNSLSVLAGSCVGGGTTVNWSASFRPPDHVRREWTRDYGLAGLADALDASIDAVHRMVNVNTAATHRHPHLHDAVDEADLSVEVNSNNDFLVEGAHQLGMACRAVPRNVKGCVDCGSCNAGCAYGAKQGSLQLLRRAAATGRLTLFPNTAVAKVLRGPAGAAQGVRCVRSVEGGAAVEFELRANTVIVAAGAIHTPRILSRSGLRHPLLGRHLALHPVAAVVGVFDETHEGRPVHTALDRGVSMGTYVCDGNVDYDGQGYGVVPETPPVHPLMLGLGLPWKSALTFRAALLLYRRCALFIGIGRDHSSAENRIMPPHGADDAPDLRYGLTREDEDIVTEGVRLNLRLMRAAGARLVFPVDSRADWFLAPRETDETRTFDRYVAAATSRGMVPNETLLFSAHQMSSCRMSATSTGKFAGVVDPSGQAWEVPGLYVMDGSILPTALGINPMITIMSMAHMLASRLADELGAKGEAPSADGPPTW